MAASPQPINRSSDKSFGWFFSVLSAAIGAWPMLSGKSPNYWFLGVGVLLGALACLRPSVLGPLNAAWFKFGLFLHSIFNPLILGLIYWISVVPVGLCLKLFGKDVLKCRFEPSVDSYWIDRDPPGPGKDSLPRQF